jgi:cytochrome c oxidase assembly protein subunit 11
MNTQEQTSRRRADLRVATACASFALFMLGVAFAAVPLYDWFCRVTGFGGTTQVATSAPATQGTRRITVRFDANVTGGLPWTFRPETRSVEVTVGETKTVYYSLTNTSGADSTGIASYNVTPEIAGSYFSKIQCFCFTDQTIKPGERREEAVVFFVDPAIEADPNLRHIRTITLSYTFFPSKTAARPLAASSQGGADKL